MKRLILCASFSFIALTGFTQQLTELRIKIENIKRIEGSMKIAVYNSADLFLSEELMSDMKVISDDTVEFVFDGLDEGTYAISVFHDENNNGKLDANFMGIPSEPYAFSNNAKGLFGPPSFEECQFELEGDGNEIVISL
ncbi:MAG: DUF2141 domain-containing protein [Ekhidna sp.]|nr:DUF2141 domain-containing protein [Ekhidna sp.]